MRVAMVVGGALLALVGGLFLLWAVLTAANVGTDKWLEFGPHAYSTETSALVFKVGDTKDEPNWQNGLLAVGTQMRVAEGRSVREGVPIFIGIARSEDVDDYLAGVEHDFVTEAHYEPHFDLEIERQAGSREPAEPGSQTFWISQAQGEEGLVVSTDIEGGLRVVVMNADAAPDVEMRGTVGVRVPWLFWAAIGGGVLGVVLIVVGAVLIGFQVARRGEHDTSASSRPTSPQSRAAS